MVAKIKIKNALKANFYYNENKVAAGVAVCIAAVNYPKNTENLSQAERMKMLVKTASANEKIKSNSVHISLNFDPSEKLTDEKLSLIANDYMLRMGFGEQPYLIYRHNDAGHPHIHILSVKVRIDGSGIDTHNIAFKKSEPARKEIEHQYGLVKAETRGRKQDQVKPVHTSKIDYGKSESRRAIANVLEAVLTSYNYTSLPELNAILKEYNVMADRCRETSRVYKHGGLLYRILDTEGNPVGVPTKASSFHNKPGLSFLENRFLQNETNRKTLLRRTKNCIDLYLLKNSHPSINGLVTALKKEGISTILRQNKEGMLYGITYIDHRNKIALNGSQLGKIYSAKGMDECCSSAAEKAEQIAVPDFKTNHTSIAKPAITQEEIIEDITKNNSSGTGLIDALLAPENTYEPVPFSLKKTRKKRKKRRLNDNQ